MSADTAPIVTTVLEAEVLDADEVYEDMLEDAIDLLEGAAMYLKDLIRTRPDWADELPGVDDMLLDIDLFLQRADMESV